MQALPRTIPLGRADELRTRDDAHLIALTYPRAFPADVRVTRYNSRASLVAFCHDGSSHHALVKDAVHPNMLTNRNTQRPDAVRPVLVASVGASL